MNPIDDLEVLDFIASSQAVYPPDANGASAEANRRYYDAMCAVFRAPRPSGVAVVDQTVGGVPVRIYRPAAMLLAGTTCAVLYAHGGGFVVGSLESHDDVCAEIAARTGLTTVAVAVDYRLAPEHHHPAPLDDLAAVWDALERAFPRIVVAGDSAGACLVAGLAIRLRREGRRAPVAQVLIYPGLGGDHSWPSYVDNAEAPMLRTADLAAYEAARFGGREPAGPRDEALPLATAHYAGLPPAFVVTADVDPLRDDGRVFVERLRAAGVPAEWKNEPQLVHGFLRARHGSRRARAAFDAVIAAIAGFAAGTRSA